MHNPAFEKSPSNSNSELFEQFIHGNPNQNAETDGKNENKPRTKLYIEFNCEKDPELYYRIGIIDFLQKYNKRKQLETRWLIIKNRNVPAETFSCVNPKLYADRFFNFMKDNLFDKPLNQADLVERGGFAMIE